MHVLYNNQCIVVYIYTIYRGPGQPKQVFISCSRARQLTLVQFGSFSHSLQCLCILCINRSVDMISKLRHVLAHIYTECIQKYIHTKRMCVFSVLCSAASNQYPASISLSKVYTIYKTNTRTRIHKYKIHAYHKRAILFLTSKVASSQPASIHPHTIRFIRQRADIIHTRHTYTQIDVLRALFTFHFSVEIYCTVKLLYTVTWMCQGNTQKYLKCVYASRNSVHAHSI